MMCIENLDSTFALQNAMASEIGYFGGIARRRWIWPIWTFPSKISLVRHSQSRHIISRSDLPISPLKILNRYFVHHATWYLYCQMACARFLNCFIEYLLLILRVTILKNLMEVFFFRKTLPYPHSIGRPPARLMVYLLLKAEAL